MIKALLAWLKKLKWAVIGALPLPKSPEKYQWSIGIVQGSSPVQFTSSQRNFKPVLTSKQVSDVPATFVADPFMVFENNQWYMFFEILNGANQRGEISLATSPDGLRWNYEKVVLREPFHLSYPYVFKLNNHYFMIPETLGANAVCLYKAERFPDQWSLVTRLLEGTHADPSVFYVDGKWWMFTCPRPYEHDILQLFFADELTGPWTEHPQSPIIDGNAHIARPAGRVIVTDNKIIRYAQDCDPYYGVQVQAFEITELTVDRYQEREVAGNPILAPSGKSWNRFGMHSIDTHQRPDGSWIACVDGH
jgi:hypothetical protein